MKRSIKMSKAYMITDGQWGSTGKGLIAGYLALTEKPDVAVCNFGAQAGHTCVLDSGETVMTQQLPTAIVSPSVEKFFLGPGCIIDPDILEGELERHVHLISGRPIIIHPSATVISSQHRECEAAALQRISSCCKGVGAAIADKVMRTPGILAKDHEWPWPCKVPETPEKYLDLINNYNTMQIESAQGMELGPNTGGFYPYCTSRDINPWQIMSDCGLPYTMPKPSVIVSMRTFPIRVGDAFDTDGNQVGTSGPVYGDQVELSWDDFSDVAPEKTTVTGKIRRIFTWSPSNYRKMIKSFQPSSIFLNFVNYIEPNAEFGKGRIGAMVKKMESVYRGIAYGCKSEKVSVPVVKWIGTGPKVSDVKERPRWELI
jgi:adenylosuccinate synthase